MLCVIGTVNVCVIQAAISALKQDYKEGDMTLKSSLDLAIKVLSKTLDATKLTAEKGSYSINSFREYFMKPCTDV